MKKTIQSMFLVITVMITGMAYTNPVYAGPCDGIYQAIKMRTQALYARSAKMRELCSQLYYSIPLMLCDQLCKINDCATRLKDKIRYLRGHRAYDQETFNKEQQASHEKPQLSDGVPSLEESVKSYVPPVDDKAECVLCKQMVSVNSGTGRRLYGKMTCNGCCLQHHIGRTN
jgi:hypothetical protein